MKRAYLIGHWVLTLLLAPFTSQAIQYVRGTNSDRTTGLLELYPITLFFSVVFSLPTLLVYITCFYFLSKQEINYAISKGILIAVAVLGIYITQKLINGTMSPEIIFAYSVTAIIVGIILKIRKSKTITKDTINAT